jgi:hypothetical protein
MLELLMPAAVGSFSFAAIQQAKKSHSHAKAALIECRMKGRPIASWTGKNY